MHLREVTNHNLLAWSNMIEFESRMLDGTDTLVLSLHGRLDNESSEYLLDCIQGHIEDGANNFILDCGELQYMSSVGLGTLVRANSRLKRTEGKVLLASVEGVVAEVLRISHLDRIFNIYPDVETAAAELQA